LQPPQLLQREPSLLQGVVPPSEDQPHPQPHWPYCWPLQPVKLLQLEPSLLQGVLPPSQE
jgi:hypothetical protein